MKVKEKSSYFLYNFRNEEWIVSEGSKKDVIDELQIAVEDGVNIIEEAYTILKVVPFKLNKITKVTINEG